MNAKKSFISNLQDRLVRHYEANLEVEMDITKKVEHIASIQAYSEAINFIKTDCTIDEFEDFLIHKRRDYDRVMLDVEGDIDFLLTAICKKKGEVFESILDYSEYYWKGVD